MGEQTFTNFENELFQNQEGEEVFMDKDSRDINIFGNKEEDFKIEGNFLDYLKETGPRESTKEGNELKESIMASVRQYYTQVNNTLETNGLPLLGDFWKIDPNEIQKTLNVVWDLIKRRGEDMGAKISIAEGKYSQIYNLSRKHQS